MILPLIVAACTNGGGSGDSRDGQYRQPDHASGEAPLPLQLRCGHLPGDDSRAKTLNGEYGAQSGSPTTTSFHSTIRDAA